MRFSLKVMLLFVALAALAAFGYVSWPRHSLLTSWFGTVSVSKNRCHTDPNAPLYSATPNARQVILPLYGDDTRTAHELASKGFDRPVDTLVIVRWQSAGPLQVESFDVRKGESIPTTLESAIQAVMAFDQQSFELPREHRRNQGDPLIDVRCTSGLRFRVRYMNDWGHYYITYFEAARPVVEEYEHFVRTNHRSRKNESSTNRGK
jgi:hypothetical protein